MDNNIIYEELKIIDILGKGSYGIVKKAIYDNTIVAAKEVTEKESYDNEITFLSTLRHRYITKLVGTCVTLDDTKVIITTYEDSFTVGKIFSSFFSNVYIGNKFKIMISYHICKALEYIHGMGVYHGDIKPDNVLLNSSYIAKICDLGMCGYETDKKNKYIGTKYWSSVEKIAYDCGGISDYCGYASDIYSFGLMLLYIFTNFNPEIDDKDKIKNYIKEADCEIRDIISECLLPDPINRPSAAKISNLLLGMTIALPLYTGFDYFLRNPIMPDQYEICSLDRSVQVALRYCVLSHDDRQIIDSAILHWEKKIYTKALLTLRKISDKNKWIYFLYSGTVQFEGIGVSKNGKNAFIQWKKAEEYNVPCIMNRLYLYYKYIDTQNASQNVKMKTILTKSLSENPLYPNLELFIYWNVEGLEKVFKKYGNELKMYIVSVLENSTDEKARILYARLLQHDSIKKGTSINNSIVIYEKLSEEINSKAIKMLLMMSYQRCKAFDKSFEYCQKLVEENVLYAQVELARMYCTGTGCLQSDSNAFKWMKTAADNGIIEGITGLAMYYQYGICTEIDNERAKEMFIIGAERGDIESIVMLAKFYDDSNIWLNKILQCKNCNPDLFGTLKDTEDFSIKNMAIELL